MKFLMIAINNTNPSPEMMPALIEGVRQWVKEGLTNLSKDQDIA